MSQHINWDEVRLHWDEYRDRIHQQWNKLTDDDLHDIRGDRQRLMQALQDRYELTKDKVEREVQHFFDQSAGWVAAIKHKAVHLAEQGKDYVQEKSIPEMAADLQRVIRRHPLRSALLSMGIGYLLAKLGSATSRS